MANDSLPIGTIIDWWFWDDEPRIPDGYELCDGQVVVNTNSPYQGKRKPNLINRFTMGVKTDDLGIDGGQKSITPGGYEELYLKIEKDGDYSAFGYQAHGDRCKEGHATGVIPNHNHGGENRPPFIGVVKLIKVI